MESVRHVKTNFTCGREPTCKNAENHLWMSGKSFVICQLWEKEACVYTQEKGSVVYEGWYKKIQLYHALI